VILLFCLLRFSDARTNMKIQMQSSNSKHALLPFAKNARLNSLSKSSKYIFHVRGGVESLTKDPVESFLHAIDIFGTGVFAFSGALKAGKKGMDITGMMIIATITAVGGGTLRDILMDSGTVFWMTTPLYLEISCLVALATFALWPTLEHKFGMQDSSIPICTSDALGLAAFSVLGTRQAANMDLAPALWVVSGLMTATFGGMIRDVICGERPRIMYPDKTLYATGPAVGSLVYTVLYRNSRLGTQQVAAIAFLATFLVRILSFNQPWRMPHWGDNKKCESL
jgi:uncharacterized membrane protein YeiH